MNRKLVIIVFTIMFGSLIPGCAKQSSSRKKNKKSRDTENSLIDVASIDNPSQSKLQTLMDVLGASKADKIARKGIISSETGKSEGHLETGAPEKSELLETKKDMSRKDEATIGTEDQPGKEMAPEAIMPPYADGDDIIEFNFENVDLEQVVSQVSNLFNVTFISDDLVNPTPQGARLLKGNKISFKTQQPLSRRDAWHLFITFLDISGFALIAEADPRFLRITSIETARKSALKSYIGVPHNTLPDSDQMIRYVYFIENTSTDTIKTVVDSLRSTSSTLVVMQDIKAIILTDKAYNIKSLMNIVHELDKVTMPQSMSILKLKRADANDVKKLYDTLIGADEKAAAANRLFPQLRKQPSSQFFPDNVRMIPEPRTNSLILLGPIDAIRRIESFIAQHVDTSIDQPYSPLFVVPLHYADAITVSNIMNEVTQFGRNTEAGKVGGVRSGDKYIKPISFTPEPDNNRIVIKGDYEDYLRAKEVIAQLDSPQPQVAIEVLILKLTAQNIRELGAALRSREPGTGTQLFGSNVKFQTTGLNGGTSNSPQGVVQNTNGNGVFRLLGNLLNLVNFAVPGNTIISLGDSLSVWGILQALQSITTSQILSNPFLVATNKAKAKVVLGEIRRVVTGTVIGTAETQTLGDASANIEVNITPQINNDGLIILDIVVDIQQFIGNFNAENPVRSVQKIDTKTIVADKEVLALGGLVQDTVEEVTTKVPILGDIPIIGWFFKNKRNTQIKQNLLILISSRIIPPETPDTSNTYTVDRVNEYRNMLEYLKQGGRVNRDIVDRWFFKGAPEANKHTAEDFIFRNKNDSQPELQMKSNGDIVVQRSNKGIIEEALQKPSVVTAQQSTRPSILDLFEEKTKGAAT